jgi:hypothetical protein
MATAGLDGEATRRPPARRSLPRLGKMIASLALLLVLPSVAEAHLTWANGLPVPDWVTRACCGAGDAHHLRADQIRRVPDGYRIEGYEGLIYDAQTLPSEDGEYWAFYSEVTQPSGDRIATSVFCFFAPSAS